MTQKLYVTTRKGLFTLERANGRWGITRTAFLGDELSLMLPDSRDGALYVALRLGHFGAKLHRSRDAGENWEEVAAPAYPPAPEGQEDKDPWGKLIPWKTERIWALEAGHPNEPGVLWAGTIPGGLFRSTDRGSSWELVRSLWDHPGRKQWFGGGADLP